MSFHNYSILLKESNGSLVVYDGADGAAAQGSTTQADVVAQISGTSMGYSYYSAVVMWIVQLPMDLHVQGTVNVNAYISSTYKLSGLLSGGGYSMGIVDIDENNNEVREFLSDATYNFGNPFTSMPTKYSQSVNVDYVFSKGHSIGFVVGLGATVQGFTASVYFGSADRSSGATLPVAEAAQTQTLSSNSGDIMVAANSAIQNLQYDQTTRTLSFNAQGIDYTSGTCAVAIPKTLLQSPFTVTQGTQTITATTTENATYYELSFTHTRSDAALRVTGSGPAPSDSPTMSPSASPSSTSQTTTPPSSGTTTGTPNSSYPTPQVLEVSSAALILLVVLVSVAVLAVVGVLNRKNRKPSKSTIRR